MKKFITNWRTEIMVAVLILGIVSIGFAAQLGNPSVVGNANKSVEKVQVRPQVSYSAASLDNASGANTAVDIGALSKDLFCVAYLSNSGGVITGLADADTASITIQGSNESTSGPGWYTLGLFSLTNTVVSTLTNTTLPAQYIRANITAIGNADSYVNVECSSRSDW